MLVTLGTTGKRCTKKSWRSSTTVTPRVTAETDALVMTSSASNRQIRTNEHSHVSLNARFKRIINTLCYRLCRFFHQFVAPCLVEVRVRAGFRGESRVRRPHTRWQQQCRRRAVDKEFVQSDQTLFIHCSDLEECVCCKKQNGFSMQRLSFFVSAAKHRDPDSTELTDHEDSTSIEYLPITAEQTPLKVQNVCDIICK